MTPTTEFREQSLPPSVEVERVSHSFGTGETAKQVLFDNTLQIFPGEITIITGPSGSGKTTLLTLVGALRTVQEGRIRVVGHELSGLSLRQLEAVRADIGFIFQAHNLFDSLSALDTVLLASQLGKPRRSAEECTGLLVELGLGERLHHKPDKLSGGQRQRVAIARALINHPRVVLADEPTAALDRESGRIVVDILKKRAAEEGTSVIIVTHDNRILNDADRIVNMVDGQIVSNVVVQEALAICAYLAKCQVFEKTPPSLLAEIANEMGRERFSAGDDIIREGEAGEKFYLIRRGTADALRGGSVVQRLGPGEFFGELALLTDQPRAATVRAVTDGETLTMSKSRFVDVVRESEDFSRHVRRIGRG